MKKLYRFVISVVALLLTPLAFAQTNISGGAVTGLWTKANSPYNINGEITLPNDSTLTIEPGVEVIFTGHYEFIVKGRLLAIGTETDTILFTINDTTGFDNLAYSGHDEGGWGGLKLKDIANSNDSTIFEYCRFQYGKSDNGGAIFAEIDKLRISHCLFRNNLCLEETPFGGTGGAVFILRCKPIIEYCEFCANKAQWNGSALDIVLSNAIIRNNHFHHNLNSATIGIAESAPIFTNNLIEQNHSNYSRILYLNNDYDSVNAAIINNTIVNNTCTQGAISAHGGFFINNIIYGNEPSQVYYNSTSSLSFYNCLIEGGKEGFTGAVFTGAYENCIDADPQFVSSNDYHLKDNSPCIGAGHYESGLIPPFDYEGNPRPNPLGSMPDIGAYENPQAIPTQTEIPAGDVSGTWTKANSPYHINGEITIPNDSTLIVEPGVEVIFTGHYKFNVQGRLLAIGTETDTILFTINDTTGFHNLTIPDGGWWGIRFMDTPSNNDSSKIVYCKLQYGKANAGTSYDNVGGALCAKVNKLLVSHCMFRNNTCYHPNIDSTAGGGIYIEGNPTIEFCEFIGNTGAFGGVMCIWGSNIHPLIRNNYFHHNGGHGTINIGSWNGSNTSPVLINNIIANNHSSGHTSNPEGHGIVHFSNGGGTTVLINNTIANNSCAGSGGAIFTSRILAAPLLINNIIYGNEPSQVQLLTPSNVNFYNCLIEGGKEAFTGAAFTGTYGNCIDVNPLFVSSNDFHLQDNSNCIGAAIDSILVGSTMYYCPPFDYEGNPRPNPLGSMPDIGAYENPQAIPTQTEIPAGDVSGTWTKANSPYHINGEITIPNDSTLIVEPGVEVIFTGHYKFNVQGRLLAIGTETDTIVFTINDTTGFHHLTLPDGGWGGIRFIDAPSTNDSSKIVYCKLQYGKANTGAGYYDRMGGALCANINKLLVSHCIFRNNTTYSTNVNVTAGGAIVIFSNPIIEFCEFTENTSSYGGAICIWGSDLSPLIRNNYFHHNQGHGIINIGSWGGSNTSPVLINNIIADNYSYEDNTPTGHGIIHFSNGGGTTVLINNTIVNNSCDISGSALCINLSTATPLLINNIIYDNIPAQVRLNVPSDLDFYNCLIEGGKEGFTGAAFTGAYENCINADPQFVSSNDYHLQNTSPCIGAGIDSIQIGTSWFYCPPNCYYGNIRPNPVGSMPDIGACEHELGTPVTAVEGERNNLPTKFTLEQNYPNPFNPATKISYAIPLLGGARGLSASGGGGFVTLKVFDVLGNEIKTLVNEEKEAGYHSVDFDGSNLPSGVYFYKLSAGNFVETKKMILLR